MQALCEWDVQQDIAGEHVEALVRITDEEKDDAAGRTPPAAGSHDAPAPARGEAGCDVRHDEPLAYAGELVAAYHARRQGVDDRIAAAAEHWELPRMLSVDRNVMRVAVAEMILGETPMKVAIDEAIEIAREYGSEDSARFVNGVLDLVYKRVRRSEGNGTD